MASMLVHSVIMPAFNVAPLHSHWTYVSAAADDLSAFSKYSVPFGSCLTLGLFCWGELSQVAESCFAMQETLDPALTRPGRFDRRVAVPMPDVRGRLDILEHYLKVPKLTCRTAS